MIIVIFFSPAKYMKQTSEFMEYVCKRLIGIRGREREREQYAYMYLYTRTHTHIHSILMKYARLHINVFLFLSLVHDAPFLALIVYHTDIVLVKLIFI